MAIRHKAPLRGFLLPFDLWYIEVLRRGIMADLNRDRFEKLFRETDQYDSFIRMGYSDDKIFLFFGGAYKNETVSEWFYFYKRCMSGE